MSRSVAIATCIREELRCRREEIDRDANLRSIAFVVKFTPGATEAHVRSVECQRYSERGLTRARPGSPLPGSRSSMIAGLIGEELARRRADIDRDDSLRQVSILVRFDEHGARVALFERAFERTATRAIERDSLTALDGGP